jgi:hypothetical protein
MERVMRGRDREVIDGERLSGIAYRENEEG